MLFPVNHQKFGEISNISQYTRDNHTVLGNLRKCRLIETFNSLLLSPYLTFNYKYLELKHLVIYRWWWFHHNTTTLKQNEIN